MGCKSFNHSVPALLEGPDTLLEFFVLTILGGWSKTSPQLPVFFLELSDSALKIGKLGLAAVSGILCSDSVAVRPGFFAFLRSHLRAGSLSGRTRLRRRLLWRFWERKGGGVDE